jgi:hypothetical protein
MQDANLQHFGYTPVALSHRPWRLRTVSEVLTVIGDKTVVLMMYCAVAGHVAVLTGRCGACQEFPSRISK